MRDIILYQPWGGLGDNLQFSTLPEIFSNLGHRVYLSEKNVTRNPEIHELVWEKNPFIAGISSKHPNAGSVRAYLRFPGHSCVTNWEVAHGFKPTHRFPKIYYSPKLKSNFQEKVFIDLNCTTQSYTKFILSHQLHKIEQLFKGREIFLLKFKQKVAVRDFSNTRYPILSLNHIYEYCDLIQSCHALVGLSSGSTVLASAIKGESKYPKIIELWNPRSNAFIFDNVEYRKSASKSLWKFEKWVKKQKEKLPIHK